MSGMQSCSGGASWLGLNIEPFCATFVVGHGSAGAVCAPGVSSLTWGSTPRCRTLFSQTPLAAIDRYGVGAASERYCSAGLREETYRCEPVPLLRVSLRCIHLVSRQS